MARYKSSTFWAPNEGTKPYIENLWNQQHHSRMGLCSEKKIASKTWLTTVGLWWGDVVLRRKRKRGAMAKEGSFRFQNGRLLYGFAFRSSNNRTPPRPPRRRHFRFRTVHIRGLCIANFETMRSPPYMVSDHHQVSLVFNVEECDRHGDWEHEFEANQIGISRVFDIMVLLVKTETICKHDDMFFLFTNVVNNCSICPLEFCWLR